AALDVADEQGLHVRFRAMHAARVHLVGASPPRSRPAAPGMPRRAFTPGLHWTRVAVERTRDAVVPDAGGDSRARVLLVGAARPTDRLPRHGLGARGAGAAVRAGGRADGRLGSTRSRRASPPPPHEAAGPDVADRDQRAEGAVGNLSGRGYPAAPEERG